MKIWWILFFLFFVVGCSFKNKKDISLNTPGPDLWFQSARLGDFEKLKLLKTELQRDWDHRSLHGVTALMIAARYGQIELIEKLLIEQSKVQLLDQYSYSALSYALYGVSSEDQKKRMCSLFVEGGSDPFQEDHLKLSPLQVMIEWGYFECIKKINFSNKSPCDQQQRLSDIDSLVNYANQEGSVEMASFFKQQGCK